MAKTVDHGPEIEEAIANDPRPWAPLPCYDCKKVVRRLSQTCESLNHPWVVCRDCCRHAKP